MKTVYKITYPQFENDPGSTFEMKHPQHNKYTISYSGSGWDPNVVDTVAISFKDTGNYIKVKGLRHTKKLRLDYDEIEEIALLYKYLNNIEKQTSVVEVYNCERVES